MHGLAPVSAVATVRERSHGASLPRSRRSGGPVRALLAAAVLLAGACDSRPLAMGDVQAITMTASPDLWAEVGDEVLDGIEGGVFTVRDDHAFRVMYQNPNREPWLRIRLLKQVLVIGTRADPWIAPVLAEAGLDQDGEIAAPDRADIVQVQDVWSRGQLVTALVLPEAAGTDAAAEMVRDAVPGLRELFDAQYREWVVARMFVTGPDSALAQALGEEHGFSLLLPQVYEYERSDAVHIFLNENPDPRELIRQFAVASRSAGPEELGADQLLEWRARIVEDHYDYPQVVNTDDLAEGWEDAGGGRAYTVRAVWQNPPGTYPAAGPFITRAVQCPEQQRVFLVDAWLYAPGKDKYEYMIQLEEILDSFRCAGDLTATLED